MELREEAWSPGPLDSEDQQMASHENPGEVALVVPQPTPLLSHQAREPSFVTLGCLDSCPLPSKSPTLPA
uniref:Zinc finger protein 787 n=1 Tax=Mus musculus TaxID=10090 RepID=A0A140LIP4_MOUSE